MENVCKTVLFQRGYVGREIVLADPAELLNCVCFILCNVSVLC